jgi:hypothetical protein
MSLYNKFSAAFAELREDYIFAFPSESTLKARRQVSRLEEGFNPIIYCQHSSDHKTFNTVEHGHIGCDEMHLKAGLWWNSSNHDIAGFEGNCQNFDDEIRSLLKPSSHAVRKLATKVNQFKYRSVTNNSFNCEYFYNPGSLSGKTLVNQCLSVIKSLEAINCKVYGLATDAGGCNANLFALLRQGITLQALWFDDDKVSFVNPVDPSRLIWIWHCTTHLLKAFCNQLQTSSPKGAKAFKDESGTDFDGLGLKRHSLEAECYHHQELI